MNELAQKDSYESFNEQNYIIQKIQIISCSEFFKFNLLQENLSLVIKIDIEGQDGQVIDDLLKIFEKLLTLKKIAIIFESHNLEIPKRIQLLLKTYGYVVLNPRIQIFPNMRNPLLRRLIKVFKGEKRQLQFVELDEGMHNVFRNFICAPENLFKE
jgi:hypothetical protein